MAEGETNLAINVLPGLSESFEVQGRGELQLGQHLLTFANSSHLFFSVHEVVSHYVLSISSFPIFLSYQNAFIGILIENMRREGFELSVSPPKVM